MDSVQIPTHLQADGAVRGQIAREGALKVTGWALSVAVLTACLIVLVGVTAVSLAFAISTLLLPLWIISIAFAIYDISFCSYDLWTCVSDHRDALANEDRRMAHITQYTEKLNGMIELFNSDAQNPPENKDMLNTTVRTLVKRNSSFFEIFTCILPLLMGGNNGKIHPQAITLINEMAEAGFGKSVLTLIENNLHVFDVNDICVFIDKITDKPRSYATNSRAVALLFTPFKDAESNSTKMPIELLLDTRGKPITPLDIQLAKETLLKPENADNLLLPLMEHRMTSVPILEFITLHNEEARSHIINDICDTSKTTDESYQLAMTSCVDGTPILTTLFGFVGIQGKWDIVNQIKKYAEEGRDVDHFDLDLLLEESNSIPGIQSFINKMKTSLDDQNASASRKHSSSRRKHNTHEQ
jgi:hypothetical protein